MIRACSALTGFINNIEAAILRIGLSITDFCPSTAGLYLRRHYFVYDIGRGYRAVIVDFHELIELDGYFEKLLLFFRVGFIGKRMNHVVDLVFLHKGFIDDERRVSNDFVHVFDIFHNRVPVALAVNRRAFVSGRVFVVHDSDNQKDVVERVFTTFDIFEMPSMK
jgi:hypothetical protein